MTEVFLLDGDCMKEYEIMVVKYGYVSIEADNEAEALKAIENLKDNEFNWSDWCNEEIVAVYED